MKMKSLHAQLADWLLKATNSWANIKRFTSSQCKRKELREKSFYQVMMKISWNVPIALSNWKANRCGANTFTNMRKVNDWRRWRLEKEKGGSKKKEKERRVQKKKGKESWGQLKREKEWSKKRRIICTIVAKQKTRWSVVRTLLAFWSLIQRTSFFVMSKRNTKNLAENFECLNMYQTHSLFVYFRPFSI